MPGSTPKSLLPTMLDTDPMATVAKAIRDLATALDGRVKGGTQALTFDASGAATFAHGLGYSPSAVVVSGQSAALTYGVTTWTATTVTIGARSTSSGAVYTGAGTIRWMAY